MAAPSEIYDIVIVGAGPAGLLLSLCLSRWGYKVKHVDIRPLPTKTGRADGIQPRTLEILRNLGLKRKLMSYGPARVYDVAFWDPLPGGRGIHRTSNWAVCPQFIDTRYPFTALLHQGRIETTFLEEIEKCGTVVDRPCTIVGFRNDGKDPVYPVEVKIKSLDTNVEQTLRTKYLFGGEGAKSTVREQLGIRIQHKDPISYVWGVMDGVVRTDFPDIQTKCTIHSDCGSIMVIPREDDMVRLYVQISSSTDEDWSPHKTASVEDVQRAAQAILRPYFITWDRVEWYSVYPIGQGIVERYTLDQRVFIGGDACHTHSPKAGQGMNTAFHDALNLAWKIHLVEAGFASRSLLETYESERKLMAENLLNFDAKYARLFSQRLPTAEEVGTALTDDSESCNQFVEVFKSAREFTCGYGIAYPSNMLNVGPAHPAKSPLLNLTGVKLLPGRHFPPCNVTRLLDSNLVALEQEVPLNGAFRIYIFAGNPSTTKNAVKDLAACLESDGSFYSRYKSSRNGTQTTSHLERHLPHSRFFTILITYAAPKDNLEMSKLPGLFSSYKWHIYADDQPDIRVPNAKAAAHEKLGFDAGYGGVVVVRPDGHVGCTVRLVEGSGTTDALNEYFGAFTSMPVGCSYLQARL